MVQMTKSLRLFFLSGVFFSRLLSAEATIDKQVDRHDKKISFQTRSIESDTKKAIIDAINAMVTILQNIMTVPLIDNSGVAVCGNYSTIASSLLGSAATLVEDNTSAANYIDTLNTLTAGLQAIAGSTKTTSTQITPLLQTMNNVFVAIQAFLSSPNFMAQNKPAVANALLNIAYLFEDVVYGSVISGQSQYDAAARTAIAFVALLDAIAVLWGDSNKLTFYDDAANLSRTPAYDTYAHTCLTAFSTLTNGNYVYTAGGVTNASKNKLNVAAEAIEQYVARLMVVEGFSQNYFSLSGESSIIQSNGFRFRSILVAPDGYYWVTDGTRIIRVNPTTNARETYTPTASGSYINIAFDGTKENIWFADSQNRLLCKFNISSKATTTYSIQITGESYTDGAVSMLSSVACGKDGNIWFLATYKTSGGTYLRSYLGTIDASGNKTFYPYESIQDSHPKYFTVDSYGNFWIAGTFGMYGSANNKVSFYKITSTGAVTRIYNNDGSIQYNWQFKSLPYGASDGRVWVVLENMGFVCFSQDGTASRMQGIISTPAGSNYMYEITEDLQKRIWIASDYVVCVDTTSTTGKYPAVQMPTDKMVRAICITCDEDGNIVFPGEDYRYPHSKMCKIVLNPVS